MCLDCSYFLLEPDRYIVLPILSADMSLTQIYRYRHAADINFFFLFFFCEGGIGGIALTEVLSLAHSSQLALKYTHSSPNVYRVEYLM